MPAVCPPLYYLQIFSIFAVSFLLIEVYLTRFKMSEDLYLEQLKLGPMENFIYILGSKSTREVTLIDPAWEIDLLFKHLEEKDLKLSSILVTHYHPDHIGGGMLSLIHI